MKYVRIVNELRKAGLYGNDNLETNPINSDKTGNLLSRIEIYLVTARNYSDTNILLPRNPLLRLVKKALLFPAREIMKIQSVFNKNVLYALEDLYDYLKEQEKPDSFPKKKA